MTTLLLPPRYTPDSIVLRRAALASGWDVERLISWRVPEGFAVEDPVLYGEPLFAAAVAPQLGVRLVEPAEDWLTTLPESLVRRRVRYGTLGEARKLTTPHFVKPADAKCFRAQVFATGADLPGEDLLEDGEPVLIQEPIRWRVEFRAFVLDGRVEALSVYSRNHQLAQDEDGAWPASAEEEAQARATCAAVADAAALPEAVVLDVGEVEGRGWGAVELNPAWGSGIYGCDPEGVLRVLRRGTRSQGSS